MFLTYVYLLFCLRQVYSSNSLGRSTDQESFTNLSITAFLDDNRNIRLNITWENCSDRVDWMSIRFNDIEDCNPIDGVERISAKQVHSIVIPHLSLINPVDNLMNGCEYEVILESNNLVPKLKQSLDYKIPDCVEDKCICEDPKKSPYQISSVVQVVNDIYFLKWKKLSNVSLAILDITCTRDKSNSNSLTQIKERNVTDDGAEILLPDLKENVNYRITVRFTHDGCIYISWIIMSVPIRRHVLSIIVSILVFVISLGMIILAIFMCSRRLRITLKNNILCWKNETSQDVYASTPLSFSMLKEQVNPQYSDMNFYMNAHKYDKYEFPRHKIVVKEEIGKGAFGVVYYAEAFELGNTQGYTKVAVKQLRMNAPDEEQQDLQNEIKILKKIGEHKNIVKLLGCVTMDQPYMMILELVTCGSLKNYLMKLRKKWSNRRSRFFFADDMLQVWGSNNIKNQDSGNQNFFRQNSENLKYITMTFDDSDDSYIHPNNLPVRENNKCGSEYISKYLSPERIRSLSEKSQAPQSPISFASSGLPSCAETETTTLSSEPSSPITNDYTSKIEAVLDNTELQDFGLQIALGMKYLEQINVTHRDLAARNILISNEKILKISDFGLSREGIYVSTKGKKLPLRWMAIEAIEGKTCNNKTDVWSFGVVLWEIGTLGAFPYQKTPNNLVLHDLKIGKRLERPRICSDELYTLMLKCWSEKPEDRLTFHEIVEQLELNKKKAYVDFSALNPTYVFPPATEDCT